MIRIVVPDLVHYTRAYLDEFTKLSHNLQPQHATSQHIERLLISLSMHPEPIPDRMPHRWMYDAVSLTNELVLSGFVNICMCEYRQGDVPEIDLLDDRPDDSLHIEARKDQQEM